jgi:hypothetical protein
MSRGKVRVLTEQVGDQPTHAMSRGKVRVLTEQVGDQPTHAMSKTLGWLEPVGVPQPIPYTTLWRRQEGRQLPCRPRRRRAHH